MSQIGLLIDSDISKTIFKCEKGSKNFEPFLVLIIDSETFSDISNTKQGKERIEYIKTESFQSKIRDMYTIFYNKKKNICMIGEECVEHLESVIQAIMGLDEKILLWVVLSLEKKDFVKTVHAFINHGFEHPYMTERDILYNNIQPGIALTRERNKIISITSEMNKVKYAIQQFKDSKGSCYLYAKLSKDAIEFLKSTPNIGITVDSKGQKTQKEMTGELIVQDVIQDGDTFVFVLDMDMKTVTHGEAENVDVDSTRYNFHSHPVAAYKRHQVNLAWPSVTDYLGVISLGNNTIFHIVATIEGLYIVSFTDYWCNNIAGISKKFVKDNFDIEREGQFTPLQYTRHVNALLYKGHPIFKVRYYSWENASAIFRVYYAQSNKGKEKTCLSTQTIKDSYNRVYEE